MVGLRLAVNTLEVTAMGEPAQPLSSGLVSSPNGEFSARPMKRLLESWQVKYEAGTSGSLPTSVDWGERGGAVMPGATGTPVAKSPPSAHSSLRPRIRL